jgi:hypothetical protein
MSKLVHESRRVTIHELVRENGGVGEDSRVEDAESFVVTHVNEVFAPDLDLGVAVVRSANRSDGRNNRFIVVKVGEWRRVHTPLERHSHRNSTGFVPRR